MLYPADTIIVERAERFLSDMGKNPPVMPGILREAFPATVIRDGEELYVYQLYLPAADFVYRSVK